MDQFKVLNSDTHEHTEVKYVEDRNAFLIANEFNGTGKLIALSMKEAVMLAFFITETATGKSPLREWDKVKEV